MLDIYNREERKKVAVLENAYQINEYTVLNAVSSLTFSLPSTDPKNDFCLPFSYVRVSGESPLYRLVITGATKGTDKDKLQYEAEHVIATLLDTVIPRTLQYDNLTTRQVIENLLALQPVKNWRLGDCAFNRFFSYNWSGETLAAAVFSIPKCFDEKYKWEFDTATYPWTLHLRKLDESIKPEYYIREGKNLLALEENADSTTLCTRLWCYGFGEGINQLTFAKINGGKEYVDASPDAIAKYGIIERVWIDRRFEIRENLLARGQTLISSLSKPKASYSVSVADIEKLTHDEMDTPKVGKIVRYKDLQTYILEVTRHIDQDGTDELIISNEPQDTAGTIAEMAERQHINEVYAQGNTFLYPVNFADNADQTHPAKLRFYVPTEARTINKAVLTWDLESFRAYETGAAYGGASTTTSKGGGASNQTSSAGGASTQTSSSGGATTSSSGGGGTSTSSAGGATTSSAGGATTQSSSVNGQATVTSASGGYQSTTSGASSTKSAGALYTDGIGPSGEDLSVMRLRKTTETNNHHHLYDINHTHAIEHTHNIIVSGHTHTVTTPSHQHDVSIPNHTHTIGDHTHQVNIPAHTHTIGNHTHELNIPNHTHQVTIPEHTHPVDIPAHTHAMVYGIYEGGKASEVILRIDGNTVPYATQEMDIVQYLKQDSSGNIQRGAFHTIEIIPNALTRISATLAVQMFIQTEGGGIY